jgi:hypothetical protein
MIGNLVQDRRDHSAVKEMIRAEVASSGKDLTSVVPGGHFAHAPMAMRHGEILRDLPARKVAAADMATREAADFDALNQKVTSVSAVDQGREKTVATSVRKEAAKDLRTKEAEVFANVAKALGVFASVMTPANRLVRVPVASAGVGSKNPVHVPAVLQSAKATSAESAETMNANHLLSRGLKSREKAPKSISDMKKRRKIRMD